MPVLTKINTNVIADNAITAAKIPEDAISGREISEATYLANTTTQNISGTYSENRLYTSDAYTLSGNATINSELVLSTVKPTGDVVLTDDGARTITGTGVLSGGDIYGKNTLTGMTGTLGTGVFPSGHIIQVTATRTNDNIEVSSTNSTSSITATNIGHSITNVTSGNTILVTAAIPLRQNSNAGSYILTNFCIYHSTDGISYSDLTGIAGDVYQDNTGDLPSDMWNGGTETIIYEHKNVSGTSHYYKVYVRQSGTGTSKVCYGSTYGTMQLMEIQA